MLGLNLLTLDQKVWLVPMEQLGKVFTGASSKNIHYHPIRDVQKMRNKQRDRRLDVWEHGQKLQILEEKIPKSTNRKLNEEEYLNLRMRVKAWMRWKARRMTLRPYVHNHCMLIYVHVSTLQTSDAETMKQLLLSSNCMLVPYDEHS